MKVIAEDAKRHPLLRRVYFAISGTSPPQDETIIRGNEHSSTLLLPQSDGTYIEKRYGSWELLVLNYLQEAFNQGKITTVRALIKKHEIIASPPSWGFTTVSKDLNQQLENMSAFEELHSVPVKNALEKVLTTFKQDGIAEVQKRRTLSPLITRGRYYDQIRVMYDSPAVQPAIQ